MLPGRPASSACTPRLPTPHGVAMWAHGLVSTGRGRQTGRDTGEKTRAEGRYLHGPLSRTAPGAASVQAQWERAMGAASRLASSRESAIPDGGQNQLRFLLLRFR